jgi:hypothetical protein
MSPPLGHVTSSRSQTAAKLGLAYDADEIYRSDLTKPVNPVPACAPPDTNPIPGYEHMSFERRREAQDRNAARRR